MGHVQPGICQRGNHTESMFLVILLVRLAMHAGGAFRCGLARSWQTQSTRPFRHDLSATSVSSGPAGHAPEPRVGVARMQVAPYSALAAQLADAEHLAALHWDARGQAYADWGNHTEGVRLKWVAWQTPEGAIVRRELVRVEDGPPPAPGYVPHFGCASVGALGLGHTALGFAP